MNGIKLDYKDLKQIDDDLRLIKRVLKNVRKYPIGTFSAEDICVLLRAFNIITDGDCLRLCGQYGIDYLEIDYEARELLEKARKVNVAQCKRIKVKKNGKSGGDV